MQAERGAAVFIWGKWLPYHFARVQACVGPFREAGLRVLGVQYSDISTDYKIQSSADNAGFEFLDLQLGRYETDFQPLRIFKHWPAALRRHNVRVAFLPSYWDWSVTMGALCKLNGCKVIMMNESHAGTEQATRWKKWIKRQIVKRFDAAFVGGEPHKRHFAALGIPAEKIFTGYDAVDDEFFAKRADEVRAAQKRSQESGDRGQQEGQERPEAEIAAQARREKSGGRGQAEEGEDGVSAFQNFGFCLGAVSQSLGSNFRKTYGLPQRYFLSLGRMVEKKNLATLVEAYAKFCDEWRVASDEIAAVKGDELKVKGNDGEKQGDGPGGVASPPQAEETGDRGQSEAVTRDQLLAARYPFPALVFVGSGELEEALREQAQGLGLGVVDRTGLRVQETKRPKGEEPSLRDGARRSRGQTEGPQKQADDCKLNTDDSAAQRGAVYFYGFRQIEENPVFYALAEAFILPSLYEEWGLVVNEAMACSLPVIVSRTAGCAEDLLPGSESGQFSVGSIQSGKTADADDCRMIIDDSLEQRSNGFVFDPTSSDALGEALRRIAGQGTKRLRDQETNGLSEMGRRSREIVGKFSCENFARQALRAAHAAQNTGEI